VGSKLTVGQNLTTGFAAMLLVVLALALSSLYSTGSLASELCVEAFFSDSLRAQGVSRLF
jgi:hypothetical protein